MAKKKDDDIKGLQFEEAIESLTEIVGKIERGDTTLQSSIEQYERGMSLINHCRDILQAAEKRIEKISESKQPAEDESGDEGDGGEELF